jgi:hypothetical protein
MPKFRKKPVVIEAFMWDAKTDGGGSVFPAWAIEAFKKNKMRFVNQGTPEVSIQIDTLEGQMKARRNDYIIQGVKGELYPCKPDIFEAAYEPVGDETEAE